VTIPLPLASEWQGYPQDLLKWTSCIDWRSASGGEARQGAMVDNWRREDRWSSHNMTQESAHRHPLLGVLWLQRCAIDHGISSFLESWNRLSFLKAIGSEK
jgi:hypothetical protein